MEQRETMGEMLSGREVISLDLKVLNLMEELNNQQTLLNENE